MINSVVLIIFLAAVSEAATLLQVQIVTRHGARTPLSKNSVTNTEGGAQLTPVGQKQMYDLGVFMLNRYNISGLVDIYNNSMSTFESSNLDRTVVSASSFALGMFPLKARDPNNESLLGAGVTPANIPVYMTAAANDIMIRAYDKCPTFSARLTALYGSKRWLDYQSVHSPLLAKLATVGFGAYADASTGQVPLKSVWNCFDAINVAKIECDADPTTTACTDLPNPELRNVLSAQEWTELQNISHYAELQKYSIPNTGDLLGGNLFTRIVGRMTSDKAIQKFYMYSAHYPTLLGLFATMGEAYLPLSAEIIPNYATALFFEQWKDETSGDIVVKTFYKEGMQATVTQLSLDGACGGLPDCPISSFQSMAAGLSFSTAAGWCKACENTAADTCMAASIASSSPETIPTPTETRGSCASTGAGMYAVGFLTAPLLYAIYYWLSARKLLCFRERKWADGGKLPVHEEENSKAVGLSHHL